VAVIRSVIRGVGAYLPKRIMTNDDFSGIVETTD
jgi:3-oxoacyl-[acyl-carrier-protein] synthase-3